MEWIAQYSYHNSSGPAILPSTTIKAIIVRLHYFGKVHKDHTKFLAALQGVKL